MTTDSLAAAMEASEDRIGDQRPRPELGGQHRSPAGVRVIESLSDCELRADYERRLREFNEELERAINEELGQVPF